MTNFEIITVILGSLTLLGTILVVYVKSQVDITKINMSIKYFQNDLDRKEIAICKIERDNKEDHEKILKKIDELILK